MSSPLQPTSGWLLGSRFDALLVAVPAAIGLLFASVAITAVSRLGVLFALDLWILSFPHVAATFTRIAFTRTDARSHAHLLGLVPLIALAATGSLVGLGGIVALNSVYFFWQSFHYARQSYGIARTGGSRSWLETGVIYSVPLFGILWRCSQRPTSFLGMPLETPCVPKTIVLAAGAVAFATCALWCVRTFRTLATDSDPREWPRAMFLLTHIAIFVIGYVLIDDLTRGWLAVNVWHNAQYLLFVWGQNRRRETLSPSGDRSVLGWISRSPFPWRYTTVCFALSWVAYFTLFASTGQFTTRRATVAFLVIMQTINFHHYVVDSIIWRRPKRAASLSL